MKSLKEFQQQAGNQSLHLNQMVNIKGGVVPEITKTGPSPAGGVCLGSFGCATWTEDYKDCGTGCTSYDNLRLLGDAVPC